MTEAAPIPVMATADAIHRIQFTLIDSNSCSAKQLVASGCLLSRPDYEDVVIERSIAGLCGYPTCSNRLPPQRGHRARYRVSLRDHRVYDLEETFKYCSEECLISSRAFSSVLNEERVLEGVEAKVHHVLRLFGYPKGGDDGSVGEGDLLPSGLSIKEKEVTGPGEVSLEELVGTESVIEGYVPLQDRVGDSEPNLSCQQSSGKLIEGTGNSFTHNASSLAKYDSNTSFGDDQHVSTMIDKQLEEIIISEKARAKKPSSKSSKGKSKTKFDSNESKDTNFTSNIIMWNEPKDQKSLPVTTHDASIKLVERLEDVALVEETSKNEVTPNSSKFKPRKKATNLADSLLNSTSSIIHSDMVDVVAGKAYSLSYESSSEVTAGSVENRTSQKSSNSSIPKSRKNLIHNNCDKVVRDTHIELEDEDSSEMKKTSLKSSMKTFGSNTGSRSVKWADEEKVIPPEVTEEDVGSSIRFASAEACATALTQAAEVVATGKAEVEDAVSEAGIQILPRSRSVELDSVEDEVFESERVITKWPKKTMLLDTDTFEVEDEDEDVWYDTPPDGFSLNLSPFATMWMALFGWINCSSLAYVYGGDNGSYEDFIVLNGMQYPRNVVLRDGQSLEIRQTLHGFISRVLPELAMDFRLPIPISTLEKFLGCLIDTMSFTDAIPYLKTGQWRVIVFLFLEALSVQRLPALAPVLTSRDLPFKQVLSAARISREEYASMRDYILPHGRDWHPSCVAGHGATAAIGEVEARV